MKTYYIQQKNNRSGRLHELIEAHLDLDREKAVRIIRNGGVWDAARKKRITEPGKIIRSELLRICVSRYPVREYRLRPEDIHYEDEDILIVFKSRDVPSHPTPYAAVHSLLHGVEQYLQAKGKKYNPGPVNRLDALTEGLVLFGKNKKGTSSLNCLIKERKIRKYYLAATDAAEETKRIFFIRDILAWKGKEKKSASFIKFLITAHPCSFFLAVPLTGRTHQIRKHFSKYIRPIRGDSLYGSPAEGPLRLACTGYEFIHPLTGKKIRVCHYPPFYKKLSSLL